MIRGSNALCLLAAVLALFLASSACCACAAERPNVLFIAVDDLNDWVQHLGGHPQCKTPNIDALAKRGVTFERAYCAAPVCNPSRTALLSGLRPSTTGVYHNSNDWRKAIPDTVTLPLLFKQNGYFVAGAGKIYHENFRRDSDWDEYLPKSHREPAPPTKDTGVGGIRFAPLDCTDDELPDFRSVTWTIEQLQKPRDKPFFLACGLHKPHMPWNVPRKYYELYPLDQIVLPTVLETDLDDIPSAGVKMANPKGDHAAILKSGRWKEAVQAYLAAIAFTDAMVGRLLAGLDQSRFKDNTIIVFWGDHGWHLGEKLHWRKFALWEEATRAPLIFVAPGVTRPDGVCKRTVDFMSIYPTLAELCGMPVPAHVEGPSIRSLLADPAATWDRPALTTHGFENHAVRSDRWRYIRYHDGSEELYDEEHDPREWKNLATQPERSAIKGELSVWLPKVNVPQFAVP